MAEGGFCRKGIISSKLQLLNGQCGGKNLAIYRLGLSTLAGDYEQACGLFRSIDPYWVLSQLAL
jgi:hypothetical protein